MSRLERDVPRHHAAYGSPQCFPIGDILRPPAMGMDDIGTTQSQFLGGEAFGACAFGQSTRGRTDDCLIETARPQPQRELQQGFLPAAPGFGRVNVDDG
jgi:hypothetical protein